MPCSDEAYFTADGVATAWCNGGGEIGDQGECEGYGCSWDCDDDSSDDDCCHCEEEDACEKVCSDCWEEFYCYDVTDWDWPLWANHSDYERFHDSCCTDESNFDDYCDPSSWADLDGNVVCGPCKGLVTNMDDTHDTCETFCASEGLRCVDAWEEQDDDCAVEFHAGCNFSFVAEGTSDAICQCEAPPTSKPTSKPTLAPYVATTTATPTTTDTVSVSATMTMDGLDASAVTDNDISAIKSGLAAVIGGVGASDITGVSVTDASTRRRALLGTAATVSFTVQVSLAETTFSDASDLESTVSSTLTSVESDSSTLIAEIKAAATSTSKWDDVTGVSGTTTVAITKTPTMAPSSEKQTKESGLDSMVIIIIAVGAVVVLGVGYFMTKKKSSVSPA